MRKSSSVIGLFALAMLGGAACQRLPEGAAADSKPSALPAAAMPNSGFRVEWTKPVLPATVSSGDTFRLSVTFKNTGDQTWPDAHTADPHGGGAGAVRLSYRWRPAGEKGPIAAFVGFESRTELPHPVVPGENVTLALPVRVPSQGGDYRLELDLVQELVAFFGSKGASRLVVPVTVR
jgi:hypothetical protein